MNLLRKRSRRSYLVVVTALVIVGVWFGVRDASASAVRTQTFRIHYTVTTKFHTAVTANWRVTCSNSEISITREGQNRGITPFRHFVPQSVPGATVCELRVVAWNKGHPHGQVPVVMTWVVPI